MFKLLAGNAGIALGALHVGDVELAVLAVMPNSGRRIQHRMGSIGRFVPARLVSHHIAHGTLGIVYALTAVAAAADRADLLDVALAGASDVVARNEACPLGFLVPHSNPPHRPVERRGTQKPDRVPSAEMQQALDYRLGTPGEEV
jgi:hypothetical protein